MQVAFVTLDDPYEKVGGIELAVHNLSSNFARLGIKVWVICLSRKRHNITIEKRKDVYYILLPYDSKTAIGKILTFIKYGNVVINKLEELGINVFIGQGGYSIPLVLSKPKKAKFILVVHTLDDENIANIKDYLRLRRVRYALFEATKYALLKLWRIIYLNRADYLIFVSKVASNEFKRHYKFLKKQSIVIPNGYPEIEITKSNNIEKKYDFAYIGRIDKRKCVDLVVKASYILKLKGYNFTVLIQGQGALYKYIVELIRRLKLERNIILKEFVKDYNETFNYISRTRFLVLPSCYESDPLILKEALSLGVPCIVSNIPALSHIIKDNINGFLFKAGNYYDLARVMERALGLRDSEYNMLATRATESVKNFTWYNIAKRYISYIRLISLN